jgi:agmatine deiminase
MSVCSLLKVGALVAKGSNQFLQFNYIPYPLWRRRLPLVGIAHRRLWRSLYPIEADGVPSTADVVAYLRRFKLMLDVTPTDLDAACEQIVPTDPQAVPASTDDPIRLPAQWEPTERVMISWSVNFPPLWEMHAQMAEAISAVADVQINVPVAAWGAAVCLYLARRGRADMTRVHIYDLPTDDIWIRDYGPFVGLRPDGTRAVVTQIYDPLPNYPQAQDDAMPSRWAAHEGLPVNRLSFHGEGGNVWSDGIGTLLMTEQAYRLNPELTRDTLEATLREGFSYEKLVLLPRLRVEETGHVDLLTKLASPTVILVSEENALFTSDRLRAARRQLARTTNADGDRYELVTLPTPPLYLNWFGFPIRRSYTNSLTVNGRVLVPVYGIATDERALRIYEAAMPGYEIVPIDATVGANGGGAVHCMTKEVPAVG